MGLAGGLAPNTLATGLELSLANRGPDSVKLGLGGGLAPNPMAADLQQSPAAALVALGSAGILMAATILPQW